MRIPLITIALLVAVGGPAGALAATYKWVDENGVTHFGDKIPPQYAKQQREVLNQQGATVRVLQHEKTAEERAEEERQKKLKELEAKDASYDRYLLQTFENESELTRMRDERLATLDGHIKLGETSLAGTQKNLETLRARAQQLQSQKKPVPPVLAKQIADQEAQLASGNQNLAKQRSERERIASQFVRDLARYRQLKAPPAATAKQQP